MAFNTSGEAVLKQVINLSQSVATSNNSLAKLRRVNQADLISRMSQAEANEDWGGIISMISAAISEEKGQSVSDDEFISQLEDRMASARAKKKAWDYEQEYLDYKTSYDAGVKTADDVLFKLERQLLSVKEPGLRSEIRDRISEMTKARKTDEEELAALKLRNQQNENIALQVYDEDNKWAQNKLQEAIRNNNPLEIERWENIATQYQSNRTVKDIKITTARYKEEAEENNWNAVEHIRFLKETISKAEGTKPITVDGVQYNSMKAYWEQQYGTFAGTQLEKIFTNDMDKYYKAIGNINGNFGGVPQAALDDFAAAINKMKADPYLADKQDIFTGIDAKLREGVEQQAKAILTAAVSSNDFQGGLSEIAKLQNRYGTDLTVYTDTLKDQSLQTEVQARNMEATRQRLAEAGMPISDATWESAVSRDIGPTEVAASNSFEAQNFGGYQPFLGRELTGFGGRQLTPEQLAQMNAQQPISAQAPTTTSPEQVAGLAPVTPGTSYSGAVPGTPMIPGQAAVQGQQVPGTATSATTTGIPGTGQTTTEKQGTQQTSLLNTFENLMSQPVPANPTLSAPDGQEVNNPFYLKDQQFLTSQDRDALVGLADNSGYANFLPLTGDTYRILKSYYSRVPGLQDMIESQLANWDKYAAQGQEKARLKAEQAGQVFDPKSYKFTINRAEGPVSTPGINATSIKKLVNSQMNKLTSGINPKMQPGYVNDLAAYNKQLMKKQLPEVKL